MKKLIAIPMIIILLLGLSACTKSSNITIGSIENETQHKMYMSYILFNGTKEKQINVKAGETIEVSVDIKTKKGNLDASIRNENGVYCYKGQDIPTSTFSVSLTEPGTYTIKLHAKNHKGSYNISW